MSRRMGLVLVAWLLAGAVRADAGDGAEALAAALERAGDNRPALVQALAAAPGDMRAGLEFLITHMPERDLQTLGAEFLLHHLTGAYAAWRGAPWYEQVPEDVFLDAILPYASVSERRDQWREELALLCRPLVEGAQTPGQAAAWLNQKVFPLVGVRYSTQRPKADQSPAESIEAGMASCTGLSILLIDACRAVGVPARFVGTPRWSDDSGNHSWVEVWDDGWHFTGAAEPSGDQLDQAWFTGRAQGAQRDEAMYAIYAVTWRTTPLTFPLVWSRRGPSVHAVNVTDRYTARAEPLAEGHHHLRLRVLGSEGEGRVTARLTVESGGGKVIFEGDSKDERFDANDHVTLTLAEGSEVIVRAETAEGAARESVRMAGEDQLVTLRLKVRSKSARPAPTDPLAALADWLDTPRAERSDLADRDFAQAPLTREQAEAARALLWEDHVARIREERAQEMEEKVLHLGDLAMPFDYIVYGDPPEGGRSLFLSMHGGGGAPKRVNDQQWENQKRLYTPEEGVYLAPRAPTDTWNLWHQAHIDPLFDRLIEDLIVFEGVDPDRVYLMGYSAGGDGVFQLAPRMADRFAAAAMMAGHPNETQPLGLRNLPFTLHMGAEDGAYHRNEVAAQWKERLAELRAADPEGYEHWVEIHEGKGHWMDREDAAAVAWLAQHRRVPFPDTVVWLQDDVTRSRFYWLAVDEEGRKARAQVVASYRGQRVSVESKDVSRVTVRLHQDMLDLDQPVTVVSGDEVLFEGTVPRTLATLARTLSERGDPRTIYPAEVTVELPDRE